jgi:predicted alpha/beta superfamily hydrolase
LRYPVVYLLDGQGHFFSVAGMIQQPLALEDNPGTRKKLEKLKAKH